jgi:hypothetical protein
MASVGIPVACNFVLASEAGAATAAVARNGDLDSLVLLQVFLTDLGPRWVVAYRFSPNLTVLLLGQAP